MVMHKNLALLPMKLLCLSVCALAVQRAAYAQAISAVRVASGVPAVLYVTAPPGDTQRLFIVRKGGQIHILNLATGILNPTQFLDISSRIKTNGEQGLLGMAFDPDYATNGKFYLDFMVAGGGYGNGVTHVSQFRVSPTNPDVADANSEKVLLTFSHPQTNHNGGWIGFSPRSGDDHNLYISTGDGGNAYDRGTGHIEPGGNAQNNTTLLGKILRIHVEPITGTVSIPPDNPFYGSGTYRQEIFAFGLRNPWRCSFDTQSRVLFIGDVGEDTREEIDAQPAPASLINTVSQTFTFNAGALAARTTITAAATPAITSIICNGQPFADGTQLFVNQTYNFVANATSDTIKVQFQRDSKVLLTDKTVPFSYAWTPRGTGPRTMTFTPFNSTGVSGSALSVSFTVAFGSPTPSGSASNYEWRLREGSVQTPVSMGGVRPPDGIDPIYDYPHTVGQCITGGYVYRGAAIPALQGTYVFGDFLGPEGGSVGRIFTFNYYGTGRATSFQDITAQLFPTNVGHFSLENPSSFGEDANHELYICDYGNGSVYKIAPQ